MSASMFFDSYPRFYNADNRRLRVNLRHEAIFGQNRDVFGDARVLDMASSEGKFSMAALEAGAAHVVGIEAREDKVEHANEHFDHYGVDGDRYRFIAGDVFDVMAAERLTFDVVLCLGYLYHTLRYNELMHHIRSTGAKVLIIDTEVAMTDGPFVRLVTENALGKGNAAPDRHTFDDKVLVGRPSLRAIETMLGAYGFAIERRSDWSAILRDNPHDPDETRGYAQGRRVTIRCRAID